MLYEDRVFGNEIRYSLLTQTNDILSIWTVTSNSLTFYLITIISMHKGLDLQVVHSWGPVFDGPVSEKFDSW